MYAVLGFGVSGWVYSRVDAGLGSGVSEWFIIGYRVYTGLGFEVSGCRV